MRTNGRMLGMGIATALIWAILPVLPAFSHCEIPCGIYGDKMRIDMMNEDIATIEKSMRQIVDLSSEAKPNYNQIVRWVVNKEHHADKFRDIVTQYFMAQRLKPAAPEEPKAYSAYLHQLKLLHEMIIYSMKCKQTTDLANVEKMRQLVAEFAKAYLGD